MGIACASRSRHPDLLLITIDTVRADRIGAYGDPLARTPAIDDLARRGTLFARATCQVPLTLPSHCSIHTGTYPPYHGVRKNGGFALDPSFDTLAEILRGGGYRTGAFLSSFSLNHIYGLDQGFDVYDDIAATRESLSPGDHAGTRHMIYPERPAAETVDRAIVWLDASRKKPTFLWVHLYDPHDPYTPPKPYDTLYSGDPYRGEIAAMDREIDRLLDAMSARGPFVTALVADHGEGLGDHGEQTHGFLLYEECLRVPLVLHAPGRFPGGAIRADIAQTVDLLPTLLDLAHFRWSGPIQGEDLAASDPPTDSLAYAETLYGKLAYAWSDLRAIRSGEWKLVTGPAPELFDLASDPGERRNMYEAERQRAEALAQRLRPILATKPDLPESAGIVEMTREEAEALAALGYVGSARLRGNVSRLDEEIGVGIDPKAGLRWTGAYEELGRLLKDGRGDSAIALAREITTSGDAAISIKASAVGSLLLWEKFGAAREIGEELVRREPGSPEVQVDLAVATLALGDPAAARRALDRAIALDPRSHLAYFNLGRLFASEGMLDSAMASLRESLRIEPKQVPALLLFTRILYEKGHAEEAYRAIREAMRLDPENKAAREMRYQIEQEFPELLKGTGAADAG